MKSIIRPSDIEIRRRCLEPETCRRAVELMREHGALHIARAYPQDLLETLRDAVLGMAVESRRSLPPCLLGHRRQMLSLALEPPFDDTRVYANPLCLAVLRQLLGSGVVINSFGAVVAWPGAEAQHAHPDHGELFGQEEPAALPPFAVTVLVPLVTVSGESGSTRVWEGSHRPGDGDGLGALPSVVEADLGDCVFMDYRLWHGGTPTTGSAPRPFLYIVYSRPWFRDYRNFPPHQPVAISAERYRRVPDDCKHLFLLGSHS